MTAKSIKTVIGALALLIAPCTAQAADAPVRPYYKAAPRPMFSFYNWTGLYAGFNVGYAFGSSNWDVPAVSISPSGMMYGFTLGYNWQLGSFVYGLEGDFDFTNIKGDTACGAFTCETKNTYLATVRGRIGYAFDRFLPYVTAGGAFGDIKASTSNPAFTGGSASKFGWTFGAGLEYAFLHNWTAKLEYLYVDLGKFDCGINCGGVAPDDVSFKTSAVRFGLNYKFSGPISSRW